MEVVYGLEKLKRKFQKSVVALGTFDGVHLGHQEIIRTTRNIARRSGSKSMVVTFEPPPRMVIRKRSKEAQLLTTTEGKEELIGNLGIDLMLIIHFNRKFAHLTPKEFVKKIIFDGIGAGRLVVGSTFRFGRNRSGNVNLLKQLGREYSFGVTKVSQVKIGNIKVSSSKIRQLLSQGRVEMARCLLGRYYTISGRVIKGSGRGKELAFPTANLDISGDVVLPRGVYAVLVSLEGEKYRGVINIGVRPTFSPGRQFPAKGRIGRIKQPGVEVHIFDFRGNLYGKKLEVSFVKRIRREMKFKTQEELANQIRKDIEFTRRLRMPWSRKNGEAF